eukprot:NODE_357_length_8846_cov_0.279410.p5 type:complete len:141 gc:universal NODE_357_length_8846_cov_0.279410:2625-2203(-)
MQLNLNIPNDLLLTLIAPIPKLQNNPQILKARPMGLLRHLFKLVENKSCFQTSEYSYAYKAGTSYHYCAFDMNEFIKRIPIDQRDDYVIKKYDCSCAFDKCDRVSTYNLLDEIIPSAHDAFLMKLIFYKRYCNGPIKFDV